MHWLIEEIVKRDIPVTIEKTDHGIGYNLNTETKSHLILIENADETFDALTRYKFEADRIANFEDVVRLVNECRCGRDFIAGYWLEYLIEYGYAEKFVKEEIVFK